MSTGSGRVAWPDLRGGRRGAIGTALVIGQRGLGRRRVLWMYIGWGGSTLGLAGYGIVNEVWQAMVIAFAVGIGEGIGNITWVTLMHNDVPDRLLGRVSASTGWSRSGWFRSRSRCGPVAEWIGVEATMIGASCLAAVAFLAFLAVPGVRDPEGWPLEPEPEPAPRVGSAAMPEADAPSPGHFYELDGDVAIPAS